jgi:hypothetical protein
MYYAFLCGSVIKSIYTKTKSLIRTKLCFFERAAAAIAAAHLFETKIASSVYNAKKREI